MTRDLPAPTAPAPHDHGVLPAWLSALIAPWRAARVIDRINDQLTSIGATMADQSALLNDIAVGLTNLASPVSDLIAENTRLAQENADLKGEDAAETTAAAAVQTAYNNLASKFASTPDVPDVPELPAPPATPDEPAPADGDTV